MTTRTIDREIRKLLDAQFKRARRFLEARRSALERIATELLERETVDGARLGEIVEQLGEKQVLEPPTFNERLVCQAAS